MRSVLNKNEIVSLKKSGQILHEALLTVSRSVKPGISTGKLDQIAEEFIKSKGGICAFKDYFIPGVGRYPAALCTSINDEIVHGIPTTERVLKEGDIISLDLGVIYEGMCTDSAITVGVGVISEEAEKLMRTAEKALQLGIEQAKIGNRIGAIGAAVQKYSEDRGYGVVRDLVGHGVGPEPHTEPQIPNFGKNTDGPKIVEGMALAIEPMITTGDYRINCHEDGWTISTEDGSLAAHFEHTVVIENGKPTTVT